MTTSATNSSPNHSTESSSPWLHAWYDPLSNVKTTSSLVRLGDLSTDGLRFYFIYYFLFKL